VLFRLEVGWVQLLRAAVTFAAVNLHPVWSAIVRFLST
jgi:hypothetical protein